MVLPDPRTPFPRIVVKPELWDTLTKNQQLSSNFDFHLSSTFSNYIKSLNLPRVDPNSISRYNDDLFYAIEDEELAKALDHHSIITSQLPDDHIQTVDEIIEEIDRLMTADEDEYDNNGEVEIDLDLCDPLGAAAECRSAYVWKPLSFLQQMSIAQLNALVDELDTCIRHHSACLVQELAIREALDYEQEVKDIFFTRLHEVQGRMEEWAKRTEECNNDIEATEELGNEVRQAETKRLVGLFRGANSATAKTLLANAAMAVRRRWLRMGRSIEHVRTNIRRRTTQPIEVTSQMCVSNSTTELGATNGIDQDHEEEEDDWSVRSETTLSASSRSNQTSASSAGHSPRRHQVWLMSTSLASDKRNPDEDLKFLSTKIPYHRSSGGGNCEGPTVGHLELFNVFLLCMLTNNPNLTPLLTDYILNVYAPSEKSMPKLVI